MVAKLIFGSLAGILLVALLAIVTENVWIIAAVATIHVVGSVVLFVAVIRLLAHEEREGSAEV